MAPSEPPRLQGILKTDSSDATTTNSNTLGSKVSPNPTPKSVSIAPKGEHISPLILGDSKDVDDLDLDRPLSPRKPRVKGPAAKRLVGRPSAGSSNSSLQQWNEDVGENNDAESSTGHSEHHSWVSQIAQWIKDEKVKRDARRTRRAASKANPDPSHAEPAEVEHHSAHTRRGSGDSVDLDALEQIIKEFPFSRRAQRKLSNLPIRRPSGRRLHHRTSSLAASSDTEYVDGDAMVPTAEVVLDNTNALSYKGGGAQSSDDLSLARSRTTDEDGWLKFKAETLRLTHTLRLKGWRRVPLEMSADISIERISGALTNAVYVVSPPHEIPEPEPTEPDAPPVPKRKPAKLLLRIYGRQVEHLIDRENELQILCRLARKHIGPRMLGTFLNGRFEEFLNAGPLTPKDLRNSDTSRHIAKRMRELHDGVDLLPSERDDGPFVWRNWDKWLARVQKVVEWLDARTEKVQGSDGAGQGFVCGTNWATFHDVVFKYRKWLQDQLGGVKELTEQLVFAHNDTQYGNILRLLPSSTSPLLLPANSHKQLVVIDFEYANANTPGLEFANHFSEWCYNYHDESAPWRCSHNLYPSPEEQDRFVRAYVRHRPDFNVTTPKLDAIDAPTSAPQRPSGPTQSISNFMLDARNPAPSIPAEPTSKDPYAAKEDAQVAALIAHTRLWRMANSAQWVAWGIVQAPLPELYNETEPVAKPVSPSTAPADQKQEEEAPPEDGEFDYLAYARDRAMFFWGDAVALGLYKLEDLPADVQRDIKMLRY
ncbi:kinase-like protein [Myriangium duriaei CBS 260.36]|uniref:Kinase-like protein n=1 Tax=Myriangium duriaei CBS 260.36 TaxID=1168546 RepID=A0A9P4MC76_9PEZI|nr:kinase-like protein [Myriangium duriaei CBS 260.36]